MNQLQRNISSLEVAEMVGREHKNVMRDINAIIAQLGELKIEPSSYFIESTYTNTQNKTMPSFLLTKQGCELYGNRMTGVDGTAFSVKYIERFNEMEIQYKQPTTAELIAMMAQQGVEQERRLHVVEEKTAQIEAKQDNITEIIALNPTEWRSKTTTILNKIAVARGGFGEFRNVRQESYDLLESRGRCKLDIRLNNRKKEAFANGVVSKTKINNFSKLDVIADDTRLTEIYLAIVKEMAIKHQISSEVLGA